MVLQLRLKHYVTISNRKMKILSPLFILLFGLVGSFDLSSQTLAQAKEMLENGECSEAIETLTHIISSKPKDSEAPYLLGLAYLCQGNKEKAEEELLAAKKKGSLPAIYELAELELKKYNITQAETYIAEYRKALKKAKKGTQDLSVDFDDRLDKISTMLDRVEKIVIIDSIEVDAESFFKHYGLAQHSGSLNSPSTLPKGFKNAEPTVVFETGDQRERLWSIEDEDNMFRIVSSKALINGNWTEPATVGDQINEGGDANYPFLMSDGVTLYFANDGENSIGGYDIFITRRDGEEFLQPTNIGFPYNSPYDDYLLAIDESRGLGWWATNRNGHPDSVTIYTFIPSDIRINYEIDNPNLASLARIGSYRDSWGEDDYSSKQVASRIAPAKNVSIKQTNKFAINIPGKGIYTSLEQFRNKKAADLMKQYLATLNQLEEMKINLEKLRAAYKNRLTEDYARNIMNFEREIERIQESLPALKNEVIKAESL